MTRVEVGQRVHYERSFTAEDVRAFGELSGDKGVHHVQPDSKGRIMVQGLLTATIPTKLGGEINYIAREMTFRFIRPVFVGDRVKCEAVVTKAESQGDHLDVSFEMTCHNQLGKEVLSGKTSGIIRL